MVTQFVNHHQVDDKGNKYYDYNICNNWYFWEGMNEKQKSSKQKFTKFIPENVYEAELLPHMEKVHPHFVHMFAHLFC